MKIKRLLLSVLTLAALILELLPNGVVLRFANPEGDPWVRTYSHFDLTPFGFANFGPLIAAVLTCILLLLVVIYLFKPRKGLNTAIINVAGFATAASLMPLMFGFDNITVIGVIITALLAGTFGCGFIKGK